jgi:transcriptional regulator with XRE-family HTH domain
MEFAETLTKLRTKAKLTRYALARDAEVDPTYVVRLERGEKRHPSRDIVLRLGHVLLDTSGDISLEDIDELLESAGYGPLPRHCISILPLKAKASRSNTREDLSLPPLISKFR